ncbi:hypothetical protein D4764_17G0004810 [Takifugu flavidus]|uniref:Uncharacterized protein n=1 Tax=Takifugu flavidus TaxID=433684 RepID=A0A5C6NW12_9TELE|nr:hypothetical protein D4764_17G0004810 [Takifugu flavidus]
MAWPPAHVLATGQRDRSPLLGWLCRAGVKDGFVRSCAAISAFPPRDNHATPTDATLNTGVGEQAGRCCAISPRRGPVYTPPPPPHLFGWSAINPKVRGKDPTQADRSH